SCDCVSWWPRTEPTAPSLPTGSASSPNWPLWGGGNPPEISTTRRTMADKPISVPQTNRVVPIAQLGGRLPVCGKLRLGVKAGRGMKSIDTFRLTSPHKDLIDAAAEHYGAKEGPRPWSDPGASP